MNIRAGSLRHRLRIQSPTSTRETNYGSIEHTWADIADGEIWGKITPLSGGERWQANIVNPDMSHTITIRYKSGISPGWRVLTKDGSRTFQIVSVINKDERNEVIEMSCVEEL
tara:strand:+ start:3580 stop:3918 length:339 start_codon:yes stop_codon:yes gene_type:complete